jgi:NTE family protein
MVAAREARQTTPRMSATPTRRTAFVLAGGGSLGAVEVGMLRVLAEHGLRPDLIVGSSVGAINAAYFAGRPSSDGAESLVRIWSGLGTGDVFPFSPVRGFFGFVGWQDGLVDPSGLRSLLERSLPYRRLEDAAVPCHIVTTDVLDGREVVLSTGDAVSALMASAAIPGVFPPVEREGRTLIDGGVASNTPVATAIALGADRLVVLPTGYSCSLASPPRGAIALALHALTLMIVHQLVVDVERFGDRAEIVVVPPLCPVETNPYDFGPTADLIARADASTRTWLATGGLERRGVPDELPAHGHALAP